MPTSREYERFTEYIVKRHNTFTKEKLLPDHVQNIAEKSIWVYNFTQMLNLKNKKILSLASTFVLSLAIFGFFLTPVIQAQPALQSQFAQTADCNDPSGNVNSSNCGIIRYLTIFINVLSVLAGVVIAGSIAYGGIQYSMSAADPQKVSAAKERIRNAIIALVFFVFGYAILNYLIPGGLL